MFVLTLIFVTSLRDINAQPFAQPATCIDDVHCSVGLFCVERTGSCQECLSCENLGRSPALNQHACIKTGEQCGPCLHGLINDANWDGICVVPVSRSMKILSSYLCIVMTCIATGILLSLFIVHGIWKTHIINVDIAMLSRLPKTTQIQQKP